MSDYTTITHSQFLQLQNAYVAYVTQQRAAGASNLNELFQDIQGTYGYGYQISATSFFSIIDTNVVSWNLRFGYDPNPQTGLRLKLILHPADGPGTSDPYYLFEEPYFSVRKFDKCEDGVLVETEPGTAIQIPDTDACNWLSAYQDLVTNNELPLGLMIAPSVTPPQILRGFSYTSDDFLGSSNVPGFNSLSLAFIDYAPKSHPELYAHFGALLCGKGATGLYSPAFDFSKPCPPTC